MSFVFSLPFGYSQIVEYYGLPPKDEDLRKEWEKLNLFTFTLPMPVKCSYGDGEVITQLRFHKKIMDIVVDTFDYITKSGLFELIQDCGGSYMYRNKVNSEQLSTHSFGIAIDINCSANRYGELPRQSYFLVDAFLKFGWVWGGFWKVRDGMHFQYARGY